MAMLRIMIADGTIQSSTYFHGQPCCAGCFLAWTAVVSRCFSEAVQVPKCTEFFNATYDTLEVPAEKSIRPDGTESIADTACQSIGLEPGSELFSDCAL
eukprot:scaffold611155_cov41-Prasinocladus_malaysianus.AAC.1